MAPSVNSKLQAISNSGSFLQTENVVCVRQLFDQMLSVLLLLNTDEEIGSEDSFSYC